MHRSIVHVIRSEKIPIKFLKVLENASSDSQCLELHLLPIRARGKIYAIRFRGKQFYIANRSCYLRVKMHSLTSKFG